MTEDDDPDRTIIRPTPAAAAVRPAAPPPHRQDDHDATVVRPVARQGQAGSGTGAAPGSTGASASFRATGASGVARGRAPLPPPRTSTALPEGYRLHEYRIDRVLGQGGFGITYLATDVHLNAPVAIKEYLPEDIAFRTSGRTVSPNASKHRDRYRRGLESFLVEARTLATFRHPNIVRVARFFEANDTAYMVLEYERGASLRQWWPAHRDMDEETLLALLRPLLDGLAVIHGAGVLHRDIKPDNIQVREGDGSLVLLDFGSARAASDGEGARAEVALTHGYAPIEQYLDEEQGPWTDIYALGATLYWLITAHAPPGAEERRAQPAAMAPAVRAGAGRFSPEFLSAIDWALSMEPVDRPRRIDEWRRALFAAHAASLGLQAALQAGEGAAAAAGAAPRRSSRFARRMASGAARVFSPSSWPLALKVTLVVLATALLPMSITGYYNVDAGLTALSDSELRNLQQLARATSGRIAQLMADSTHLARMLGADDDFRGYLAHPSSAVHDALTDKVVGLARANPDVHLVMIFDTTGTVLLSNDPEVAGKNFAFREYFKAAMQGRPYVTGIVVGAVAGAAGVFFSEPVLADDGRVIGAVVLRIRASSFESLVDDAGRGTQRLPFVVDGDGVVILHPQPRFLYESLAPLAAPQLAAIRADHRFRRDVIHDLGMSDLASAMLKQGGAGHVVYRSAFRGDQEIAGFSPVPGTNWVVGISEPQASFEAPLRQLFVRLLISLALVGMFFTGFALRFARGLVRPIRALARSVEALQRGDYEGAAVDARGRDELGRLARAFNIMIDVLRQRERERDGPGGGAR